MSTFTIDFGQGPIAIESGQPIMVDAWSCCESPGLPVGLERRPERDPSFNMAFTGLLQSRGRVTSDDLRKLESATAGATTSKVGNMNDAQLDRFDALRDEWDLQAAEDKLRAAGRLPESRPYNGEINIAEAQAGQCLKVCLCTDGEPLPHILAGLKQCKTHNAANLLALLEVGWNVQIHVLDENGTVVPVTKGED